MPSSRLHLLVPALAIAYIAGSASPALGNNDDGLLAGCAGRGHRDCGYALRQARLARALLCDAGARGARRGGTAQNRCARSGPNAFRATCRPTTCKHGNSSSSPLRCSACAARPNTAWRSIATSPSAVTNCGRSRSDEHLLLCPEGARPSDSHSSWAPAAWCIWEHSLQQHLEFYWVAAATPAK